MFNESTKQEFIRKYSESESVRARCEKVFNTISAYEESCGADVSCFSEDQIKHILSEKSGLRHSSIFATVRILNDYLSWLERNGFSSKNSRITFDDDDIVQKYRNKMAFGTEHLVRYFDAAFGNISDKSVYITYRCFLWLAFVGLDVHEAMDVRTHDVDTTSMFVRVSGRVVPLYEESIPDFVAAKTLNEFRVINPLAPDKIIMMPRDDGDRLLRRVKRSSGDNANNAQRSISIEIPRCTKRAVDKGLVTARLNYSNIKLSGIFYRMYLREIAGSPVSFLSVAEAELVDDESSGRNLSAKRSRIIRGYERDYEVWKRAYELYVKDSHL